MIPGARSSRPIRVGISSCLLGEAVRFDGGHKRDAFLTDTFGRFVEWVPVCPEVECGLGTPRESMRLVRVDERVRLLTVKTRRRSDRRRWQRYARAPGARSSRRRSLCGYVLKKDSPSCGLERVKVYDRHGVPTKSGRGLFAAALVERFPHLPVEEEGRLSDPRLRENFVERVFAYWRLRDLFAARWNVGRARAVSHRAQADPDGAFARGVPAARAAVGGRARRCRVRTRGDATPKGSWRALAVIATPRRHTNVLQHMVGYFKNLLDGASKAELLGAIEDYRRELVPLVVPLTLLRHHVRVHDVAYLAGQLYLEPHPKELMLRNMSDGARYVVLEW